MSADVAPENELPARIKPFGESAIERLRVRAEARSDVAGESRDEIATFDLAEFRDDITTVRPR